MSIDIEQIRARAEWFRDSLSGEGSIGGYGMAAAAIQSAEDVPALLDEVERQERAIEALVRIRNQQAERAEKAEAERDRWKTAYEMAEPILTERDRLRAAVEAVRALVAKGWVDFHNTEVTVDLPAIRAALDEHLGEG